VATQSGFSPLVRFADFELDLRTGELRRDGTSLKLQPQPAKVLVLLVSRAGEIVTRQDLARQVWGSETFVDFERGLNFAIRQIRSALEDDADHPRFLETLPKRGYRFTAPVSVPAAPPEEIESPALTPAPVRLPRPRRLVLRYVLACLAAAAIAITLPFVFDWGHIRQRWSSAASSPRIESVAVLPLQNLSRDPEQEYFSDGMTDELITELAKFGRLRVISHTSVERYKGAKRSLPEIARELGVDAIVEGTVVRAGDRVRITAQLIEARSDRHLWAESYERDLRDVLGLQDEVAERIATAVGINLAAGDQTRMASTRVVDSAAHEAYLKGNFYWNRSNCEGSKRALEYFQQAVDKDSNFAPAYLGLAQSYFTLGDWGCWPHHEAFAKSKAQALRAIELDHNLGAAYTWLGMLAFFYEWEWQNAEKEFRQAIELDPNYSFAHLSYAVFLVTMGKPEQAFVEMRRAHELDPTSELTNMVSVHVLYLARQYDQAIEQAKVAIELNPGSWGSYIWLGESYERKGMYEQASAAYLKSKALEGLGPEELAAFRSAYLKSGIRGHWQQELATVRPNKCSITVIYAHLGDKDRTLKYLSRDFQNHCTDLRMLNVDAIYDSLRKESRFQDVLHRMKFPG
jgi:TolB-like protein/DNA-binding winged helix-turn-helix (wHTH) protein